MCTASASSARLPAQHAADDLDDRVRRREDERDARGATALHATRGRDRACHGGFYRVERAVVARCAVRRRRRDVREDRRSEENGERRRPPHRRGSDARSGSSPGREPWPRRRSGGRRPTSARAPTIASLSRRKRPYCVSQRSLSSGRRSEREVRTREHHRRRRAATASRAKPRNAVASQRRARAATRGTRGRRHRPPRPTRRRGAASPRAPRASVAFGSVAWWPDSERPDTSASESTSAGQRSSSRSKIQPTSRSAATTPKPTVITRNAMPNRVFSANGWRSPYGRSAMGSCSAFDARSTNAAMPTSTTRNARDHAGDVEAVARGDPGTGPRRTSEPDDERPDRAARARRRAPSARDRRARSSRRHRRPRSEAAPPRRRRT